MAYVEWSPLFSVEVAAFDREHRALIEIINRFHDACGADGPGPRDVFGVLNALVKYAEEHFAHEQAAMDRYSYPDRIRHRFEHDRLLGEVFELNRRLAEGEVGVTEDIAEFLKSWLLHHILETDRKYGPFLAGREV